MAKVSICVPTYNNVSEVERLLQSIRRQNYTDYEVNISDDSTNDETEELVEEVPVQNGSGRISCIIFIMRPL